VLGEHPDYVVLIVEDVARAVGFYTRALGLRLAHDAGTYAQLDTGPTRVGLYQRAAMSQTLGRPLRRPDPDRPGFELGFKVADCDQAYARLLGQGAEPGAPPTDRPWGQRTAYVLDPDGHLVELAEDLTAAPPSRSTAQS
jgi:catechol 2,3-dioxygenase-like lactoylglutathione lyase family enzyme